MNSTSGTTVPRWSRTGATLAGVALLILLANVALIFVDVLARWLLRSPQSWVADIGQISYPVAIACCFPAALESGHMISIRFLGEAVGPRRARWLDLLGQLALLALLVLFSWKLFARAQSEWSGGFRTANIALPVGPTWFIVAALLALCVLVQARAVLRLAFTPEGPHP